MTPIGPGTRLGPYEIVASLGAGGMGEVYKARDTRLNRTVAIKILPQALAADPQFRERFDREARAISALDHPHICALYDVGDIDGAAFLVMQFLEGETLEARIARGALPLAEAMTIASQIADALDRAHRAGIVHRDLKPGNVILTRAGVGATGSLQAKLLDFGLAKQGAGRPAGRAGSAGDATRFDLTAPPTRGAPLTQHGAIVGTIQYMAPEQLEGIEADERADIWAFGVLLYEMVTRRRAFEGQGQASLIGAIMTAVPAPVSEQLPLAPRALDRLIAGCLAKDREERWQSIRDVKRQLEGISSAESPVAPATARRKWPRIVLVSAAAFVGVVAGMTALGLLIRREVRAPVVRFDLGPPKGGAIARFGDTSAYFAASPDGARVAFVATSAGKPRGIWIKALDQATAQFVEGSQGGTSPFWSPDGRLLAFFATGQLKKSSLDGGPPQTICEAPGAYNGTWNNQGTILFDAWGLQKLMRVSQDGGTPSVERAADLRWPSFLPEGRHYTFLRGDRTGPQRSQAFVGALGSSDDTPIPGVESRTEYASGRLFFLRDGTLLSQPFDLSAMRLTGMPAPSAEIVHGFYSTGFGAFSVGPRLLVYQAGSVANRLVWFDRQGRELESVGTPMEYVGARLAPDGSSVAASARDPQLGSTDIWIHDLKRGMTRHVTTDKGLENLPAWTPDGRTLIYPADRRGAPHLHARDVTGSDEREITPPMPTGPQSLVTVTPDGRQVLFTAPVLDTSLDIFIAPIDGSSAPLPLVHSKARDIGPRVSPNGRWLAYVSDESGRNEVYVRPLTEDHPRVQVSRAGGNNIQWRADGREIFYTEAGARLMAADVAASPTFEAGALRVVFGLPGPFVDYSVSNDGQRFLFVMLDREAEAGTLSAVLNWTSLFQKGQGRGTRDRSGDWGLGDWGLGD